KAYARGWNAHILYKGKAYHEYSNRRGGGLMVFFATRGLLGPSGTIAGDIDVGTEVILNENGQPVNYLIVNQGIPSALYDASCDGTWLLRKDIAENRQWHSSNSNSYKASTINAYLNGDWMSRYDPNV